MNNFGFKTAAIGTLVGDVVMLFIVLNQSLRLLNDRAGGFVRYIFSPFNVSPAVVAE
jgi:hypothetical protein